MHFRQVFPFCYKQFAIAENLTVAVVVVRDPEDCCVDVEDDDEDDEDEDDEDDDEDDELPSLLKLKPPSSPKSPKLLNWELSLAAAVVVTVVCVVTIDINPDLVFNIEDILMIPFYIWKI